MGYGDLEGKAINEVIAYDLDKMRSYELPSKIIEPDTSGYISLWKGFLDFFCSGS